MSETTTSVKEWWKFLKALKKNKRKRALPGKKNNTGHLKALLLEDLSV